MRDLVSVNDPVNPLCSRKVAEEACSLLRRSLEFHLSPPSGRCIYRAFEQFYSLPRAFRRGVFRRVIAMVPLGISPSVDQRVVAGNSCLGDYDSYVYMAAA